MKNNFKAIMVAALALTAGLSSCVKDDNGVEDTDTRYVFLKVDQPATRATGTAIADGTAVSFTDGYVFFTDGSGKILNRYTIIPGNTDESGGNVGLSKLTSTGANFPAVKSTASQVYIIGNTSAGTAVMPAVNDNIHTGLALAAAAATVTSQANSGDVSKVGLYGMGTITNVGAVYSAAIDLYAISARFEISSIKGTGNVDGFTIDGIFINKYYEQMGYNGIYTTGGVANAATFYDANYVRNNYDVPANYAASAGSYTSTAGVVYDASLGAAVSKEVKPSSGVWAYNLLAPKSGQTGLQMNSIVIKLSNVTVTAPADQAYYTGKTFFLTINNFYDGPDPSNDPKIDFLANGYVYKLGDIEFLETDLSLEPEKKTKAVSVTATPIAWKAKDISYDFD